LTQARNLQTFLGLQLLVLIRFVHYNTLYALVLRFRFEPAQPWLTAEMERPPKSITGR
jgi:hypothetical protein